MSNDLLRYKQLARLYFLVLFLGIFCIYMCLPVVFYFTDPLQLFRKSQFQSGDRLNKNMRIQAAGIINNFQFDSIILGSSQLENTSAREASEKLGGQFFNLSLSGSDFFARSFVLKKALQKNIKSVIYSLEFYFDVDDKKHDFSTDYWSFLYDDSRLNDFRIYFQKKFVLRFYNPLTQTQVVDLDRPNAWYQDETYASLFGGLEKWVDSIDSRLVHDFLLKDLPSAATKQKVVLSNIHLEKGRLQKIEAYIEKNLLHFVRQYPKTTFYFIFPPAYRYQYADMFQHKPQDFLQHQAVIRYFVEQTKTLPNMHLYGFEDEDFVDDIANYRDTTHYHYHINSYFLDAIAAGQHELTPESVDAYLKRCREKAEDFDFANLNRQVQELIRNRVKK